MKTAKLPNLGLKTMLIVGLSIISFNHSFSQKSYSDMWDEVTILKEEGRTSSAIELTEKIIVRAEKDGENAQKIKGLIHKMYFRNLKEENAFVSSIKSLENEISNSNQPSKSILHSAIAEMYWWYYQANQWEIHGRSNTEDFDSLDITTWTAKNLIAKVVYHYDESLRNSDSLKKTDPADYDLIWVKGKDGRSLRPTLYDVLAHRSLDFYQSQNAEISAPRDQFTIDDKKYLSGRDEFLKLSIPEVDYISFDLKVMGLYQDIISFHMTEKNDDALLYNDLSRIQFAFIKYKKEDGDSLFLSALNLLQTEFNKSMLSSEVLYIIANYYHVKANAFDPVKNPESQFLRRKSVTLCEEAIRKYPDSRGAEQCASLLLTIQEPNYSIETEKVIYPNEEWNYTIRYKNVKKLYFRIVSNKENILIKEASKIINPDIYYFLNKKALREWSIDLPDSSDYQYHRIESAVSGIDKGYYVLLISLDEDFNNNENVLTSNEIWSSEMAYFFHQDIRFGAKIIVVNRKTGKPQKGVKAYIYSEKYNYEQRGRDLIEEAQISSDVDGKIELPIPEQNANYHVLLTKGSDSLVVSDALYVRSSKEKKNKAVLKTAMFTDRAVYRPGQIIYFKGLLMEKEGFDVRLVEGHKMTVKLFDVNNQEMMRREMTTSEYGTFQGSFNLPTATLTGSFVINDGATRHRIQVEEYKRPTFEIEIDKQKENIQLGSEIVVEGSATSYNGVLLSGAKGTFHVTRNVRHIWSYYRGYYPQGSKTEIAQGKFQLDEKGKFKFNFKAVPDKSISKKYLPVFTYQIEVLVTDVNGETQKKLETLPIGYHTLQLSSTIKDELNKEKVEKIKIETNNLSGVFTSTDVEIQFIELKKPTEVIQQRLWPRPDFMLSSNGEKSNLNYNNEKFIDTWELGDTLISKTINTGDLSEIEIKEMQQWQSGAYLIRLSGKDPFGQGVNWSKRFILFGENDEENPIPTVLWAKLLSPEVRVGENAKILLTSANKSTKIYQVIGNKNGLVEESWIEIKGGKKILEIPIHEEDKGAVSVQILAINNGRLYREKFSISVPNEDKKLTVKLESFRKDLRPGDKETWKVSVRDKDGNPVQVELLASMYDMSLDVIKSNSWHFNPYYWPAVHVYWNLGDNLFSSHGRTFQFLENNYKHIPERTFDRLNWFGFSYFNNRIRTMDLFNEEMNPETTIRGSRGGIEKNASAPAEQLSESDNDKNLEDESIPTDTKSDLRTNFRETAFFYPELKTDSSGNSEFSFEVPDALTKWKLQLLAHSKELQIGQSTEELITKKELMVTSNFPRFLTSGDTILFSAKISNLTDSEISVKSHITISDPISGVQLIDVLIDSKDKTISIGEGLNSVVKWKLKAPANPGLIEIAVYAESKDHRDGESKTIPILSKSILVTESFPISLRAGEKKEIKIDKLDEASKNLGIEPKRLTIEFTPNPIWYVIQALPYLSEINNESSGQIFNRFYANSIAFYIAGSNEKIQKVFNVWKQNSKESFRSQLEKNAELKSIVLSETPWLLEAKSESEDKAKVANFFDENNMRNQMSTALFELLTMQSPNGGWPWFKGMEDNPFITQNIVLGMGRLDHLGLTAVRKDKNLWARINLALHYMDNRMEEDYQNIITRVKNKDENRLRADHIQYLFARSYFKEVPVDEANKEAIEYFTRLAKLHWLSFNKYQQAMIALAFFRNGDAEFANKILVSLKENAIQHDEFGMYWKKESGYYWYQSDVEKQAMIIEAFEEISNDQKSVDEMKIYLLKQKQTHMWNTGRATTEACYALLIRGSDLLTESNKTSLNVGSLHFDLPVENGSSEAGTSYTKMNWNDEEIKPEMKDVVIENNGKSVSWGAVYFQYFQSSDKVESAKSALSISRELYVKRYNEEGVILKKIDENERLETGDVVVVKFIVKSDRDLEFVHLKDMRAAGLEPFNTNSGYRYSGGRGYYLSIKDAATHFYFNNLLKGTYLMEYELKANVSGSFTSGISTIQSFYAPEFSAHSKGQRIIINGE